MKKVIGLLSGLNIILVIVLLNVVVAMSLRQRWDLTENKVHSLSKESVEVIEKVDDLVKVKVYISEGLPSEVEGIADSLRLVLGSMEDLKSRRFLVEYVNTSEGEEGRDEAERMGIEKLQFSSTKKDKFEIQEGYFGLVVIKGDEKIVLPVAGDVGKLEYLIVAALKKLEGGERARVAVAEEVWDLTGKSEINSFKNYLANDYEIYPFNFDNPEDGLESFKSLIIVGRVREMSDERMKEIAEWHEKGGSLLVFADLFRVDANLESSRVESRKLFDYLGEKGLQVGESLIIDKSSAIASFGSKNGNFLTQYPYWIQIQKEKVNDEIPAMSGVSGVMLPWVSDIKLSKGSEALLRSSGESNRRKGEGVLAPSNQIVIDEEEKDEIVVAGINKEKRAVLVADSDFIRDQFLKENSSNLIMALNLVDYFSGDSSLLRIRSKNIDLSLIRPVENEEKAKYRTLAMISPLLIIGLSIFGVYLIRKSYNKNG